ncbi:tobamovirus multiplication 2A-like [Chlorella sorokiniana]|uniref:Tobamovirus multiplication 2A-like n=1 Tax=Chlorella sorokiniana TaxID=3076 RepID=A0A2P6U072_CHLSO|nr:tobamovirus multiplication 2A-like [Chlorella sorokiniana]|eukprot:PRW59708.1 tobamovirus multiplication 2A-like [Chlorella sorokiniana]
MSLPADKPRGLAERGASCLAWNLRLFSVLQLAAGIGYVVLAVFLQFPPGDPLTLGLWAIGCLAILTAIFGLAGGCCRWGCCLGVYLVLSVLATLAQAGFVLFLFIDPARAEREVAKYQRTRNGAIKDNLHDIIIYGRWGLLGLLAAQVLAIAVAAVLRCCSRHRQYEEFQEEEEAEYEARRAAAANQLDSLKSKLGLAAAVADSPTAAAAGSKRVINISAVSGSAAERMQQQASAAASMRSVLFERSNTAEDGKLEVEMEAGKIGSRVVTDEEQQQSTSTGTAWRQSGTPSHQQQQQRPFKPSWSKQGKNA